MVLRKVGDQAYEVDHVSDLKSDVVLKLFNTGTVELSETDKHRGAVTISMEQKRLFESVPYLRAITLSSFGIGKLVYGTRNFEPQRYGLKLGGKYTVTDLQRNPQTSHKDYWNKVIHHAHHLGDNLLDFMSWSDRAFVLGSQSLTIDQSTKVNIDEFGEVTFEDVEIRLNKRKPNMDAYEDFDFESSYWLSQLFNGATSWHLKDDTGLSVKLVFRGKGKIIPHYSRKNYERELAWRTCRSLVPLCLE